MSKTVDDIFNHFKTGRHTLYEEEKHCKMLIQVMLNPDKGTVPAFCVEAMIAERTFYEWTANNELFSSLYCHCKMIARKMWDEEGARIRDMDFPMGTVNYQFEHWKMMGWSRFGISRNSKIKINVKSKAKPDELYETILKQAADGDFTAAEFKQLMEAVNIGLNVHQNYELQRQIDELKSAQAIMEQNSNVKNTFTD